MGTSRFFKMSVNLPGSMVTSNGTSTDPKIIKDIRKFPEPKTVFGIGSFMSLASYYRAFIKYFAAILTPISEILKWDNGTVSKQKSRNIAVQFLGMSV